MTFWAEINLKEKTASEFRNQIPAISLCKEKYSQELLFSKRGEIQFLQNQCPVALPAPLGMRILSTIS
jgi:hypothetical protein